VPFEHVPEHEALSPSQFTWHGPFEHLNAQLPPGPQLQLPLAHVPLHESPLQSTWQGDALHENSQSLPLPHVHSPLPHAPLHSSLFPSQSTWQGGSSHSNSHELPDSHTHVPSSQSSSSHPTSRTSGAEMTIAKPNSRRIGRSR
jgi:hypothetical protein